MKKYILPRGKNVDGTRHYLLRLGGKNDDGTRYYYPMSRSNLVLVTKITENQYVPYYFFQCGTAGGAVKTKTLTRKEIIKLLSKP